MSNYMMTETGVVKYEKTHFAEKILGWDCILVVHPKGGAHGGPYAVVIDGELLQCVGVPVELRVRAEAAAIKAAADPNSPVGRYNAPEAVAARNAADEKARATQVARRQSTSEGMLSRAQLRDERDAELESGWGYD